MLRQNALIPTYNLSFQLLHIHARIHAFIGSFVWEPVTCRKDFKYFCHLDTYVLIHFYLLLLRLIGYVYYLSFVLHEPSAVRPSYSVQRLGLHGNSLEIRQVIYIFQEVFPNCFRKHLLGQTAKYMNFT